MAPSTGSGNIFLLSYGILKFDSDRSCLFVTYFFRMESHISVNFWEILSPSIIFLWNSYHVDVEVSSPVLMAPDWLLMLHLTCFLSWFWAGSAWSSYSLLCFLGSPGSCVTELQTLLICACLLACFSKLRIPKHAIIIIVPLTQLLNSVGFLAFIAT